MAKRGEKSEAESKSARPSEVSAQIGKKKLEGLLRAHRNGAEDISTISGNLGKAVASAVENDHLHRKAFRAILAEDKMTPEKLAEYYDVLELYRDMSGLNERAKSAPRLALEPGEEDGEEVEGKKPDAAAKGGNGNVKPFPAPATVPAE